MSNWGHQHHINYLSSNHPTKWRSIISQLCNDTARKQYQYTYKVIYLLIYIFVCIECKMFPADEAMPLRQLRLYCVIERREECVVCSLHGECREQVCVCDGTLVWSPPPPPHGEHPHSTKATLYVRSWRWPIPYTLSEKMGRGGERGDLSTTTR